MSVGGRENERVGRIASKRSVRTVAAAEEDAVIERAFRFTRQMINLISGKLLEMDKIHTLTSQWMNREHRRSEKRVFRSWSLFQCFLLSERREANIKIPFINSTKSDIFFLLHKKAHARTHPTIDFGECVILLISFFVLVVAVNFNFSVRKSFSHKSKVPPLKNFPHQLDSEFKRSVNCVLRERRKSCGKFDFVRSSYRYWCGSMEWQIQLCLDVTTPFT